MMDSLEYWMIKHKGVIWHYTWRGAFVLLLVWAMRNGYVSMLQVACFGGICFCIASLLMLSVKLDRKISVPRETGEATKGVELDELEGKDRVATSDDNISDPQANQGTSNSKEKSDNEATIR